MKKAIVVILVIVLIVVVGVLLFNTNVEVEYVPEAEIEDVDLRKTMVALYFQNAQTKELQKETRLIDSKELLLDPYAELLNMLIDGPQSDFLAKTIPEGTKMLGVELVGGVLQVNFSKEFVDKASQDENEKKNCMDSITKTLMELNEVTNVKFLVEGQEIEQEESLEVEPEN